MTENYDQQIAEIRERIERLCVAYNALLRAEPDIKAAGWDASQSSHLRQTIDEAIKTHRQAIEALTCAKVFSTRPLPGHGPTLGGLLVAAVTGPEDSKGS
jgi:hypothetical protein